MYIETMINTISIYFIILIVIRLLGKREIGEISIFDLVVLLLIADISTIGIQNNNLLISIISLVCLLILQKALAIIVLKFPTARKIFDGQSCIIIINNKVNIKEMKKQRYTFDDLITQARMQGAMSLNEIELAILESSGELSLFKKEEGLSILPIIVSGKIDKESMLFLNIEESKVNNYLSKINKEIKDIYYLSSDGVNFYSIEDLKKF